MDNLKLTQYIERLERLDEQKKGIQADITEVLKEAANDGFNKKALKMAVKKKQASENAVKKNELEEVEYNYQTYSNALGLGE